MINSWFNDRRRALSVGIVVEANLGAEEVFNGVEFMSLVKSVKCQSEYHPTIPISALWLSIWLRFGWNLHCIGVEDERQ